MFTLELVRKYMETISDCLFNRWELTIFIIFIQGEYCRL